MFLSFHSNPSNVQLKQMFAAYQQISGTDIEQDIQERVDRALYEIYTTICTETSSLASVFSI